MSITPDSSPEKPIRGFCDLIVWQRAMQLFRECDRLSERLILNRRFSMSDQMFRASLSIPSNIAEGQGALSKAANVRHLAIARGSLFELKTLLIAAESIDVLSAAELKQAFGFADEVGRMLTSLIRKLGTRKLE